MPLSMKDLKGRQLEVAQELLRMGHGEAGRVIEVVRDRLYEHAKPVDMKRYEPALIWSRATVLGVQTCFFTDSMWDMQRAGRGLDTDGRTDWSWTSMTLAAQLGYPLEFERREIRLYPGSVGDAERLMRLVTPVRAACHCGMPECHEHDKPSYYCGGVKDHFRYEEPPFLRPAPGSVLKHMPLQEPAHPLLRERAARLLSRVNEQLLPCAVFDVPRKFGPLDNFWLCVETAGDAAPWTGMDLTAVYMGTLHSGTHEPGGSL